MVMVCDQDLWAKQLDYSRVPLDLYRGIYESVRNAIVYYAETHYEKHGQLEFIHSVTGVRTLKAEFDKIKAQQKELLAKIAKLKAAAKKDKAL